MTWPPPYQIRKSKRAKYLQCQIKPGKGLEIIVPQRLRAVDVLGFLEAHKQWILKNLEKYPLPEPTILELPKTFHLCALEQTWHVHYPMQITQRLRLTEHLSIQQLFFNGVLEDKQRMQQKLKQWLIKYAEQTLLPWLKQLSAETNLRYQKAGIRAQRSVWGTCNAKGVINLNYQLLFLPGELVRHIMLHELCHLRHLDHSARFWQLLSQFDLQWQQHRKLYTKAQEFIPQWLNSVNFDQD